MTKIDRHLPPDEQHYSEPEILPPSRESEAWGGRSVEERGTHRIYVTRVGPFGLLPFMLLGGIISIALLVFLFGFLLILIPVAGVVLAAAIVASLLRGPSRW
jgi:hypothetical protein